MYLTDEPIDLAPMLASARPSDGGVCTFIGIVRDQNAGRPTRSIEYQAYATMAEAELGRIAESLARDWADARVSILHRVGTLAVGEIAVAIVACAPHRSEAFAACRAAIDRIKTTVPIWKREFHTDGTSAWVDPTGKGAAGTEKREKPTGAQPRAVDR